MIDRAPGPNGARRPVVSFVFTYLVKYRKAFYNRLREELNRRGVDINLIYGQPGRETSSRQHALDLTWGTPIRNTVIPIGSRELFWQPALPLLRGSDLVVVDVASKLLLNYVLILDQVLGRRRVAFLGHGFNARQQPGTLLGEWVKGVISRRPHWWFAYNDLSVDAVVRLGYPRDRITSVQNAIDTRTIVAAREAVTPERLQQVRQELGLRGENVGLFLGGMYSDKLLPFIIQACDRIRQAVPDFEMLFMGAGPDEGLVREAAATRPWMRYLEPRFDGDKVPYCLPAKVLLLPGAVGLTVLDSFGLQIPLVTLADRYHGPEITYLEGETNGVLLPTAARPEEYAREVVGLLRDDARLARLRDGCARAARRYTVEEMAQRFAQGVTLALAR